MSAARKTIRHKASITNYQDRHDSLRLGGDLLRASYSDYTSNMSTLKTVVNDASVTEFINAVPDATKRDDSFVLLELFSQITGEKAKMWGPSIIGFGQYHYKSEKSSQEGDWLLTGFSPRKQNLTLYIINGFDDYADLLADLGKHKTSKSCLYITKLADVDIATLKKLIKLSFEAMKKNT